MLKKTLCTLALLAPISAANAALINFEGDIQYHNDVVTINFTLDNDATDVRVWTDSFESGTNFDPITALWRADGTLIEQDDDNPNVDPATQTYYDSGFTLPTLAAGDYFFTVATYNNFANGSNITDGFSFDNQTAIALADWDQPANSSDMGTHWSVWLDGVDSATNPNEVPEPSSIALLGLGLLGLARFRKQS
mgnify:CR=1 FL=1